MEFRGTSASTRTEELGGTPPDQGDEMQIRDVGSNLLYHVHPDIGKKLVGAGLAVEIKHVGPYHPRQMSWSLVANHMPWPVIKASCPCGSSNELTGPTAHITQKVGHCGIQEVVPKDIAARYGAIVAERKVRMKHGRG